MSVLHKIYQNMPMPNHQRYEGLDHLRGLLAIIVMFYHFSFWLGYEEKLHFLVVRPLGLLGLYAVSTFYCLSGAALFIVYQSYEVNLGFFKEFSIKRAFRICPLFWAATTASLAMGGFTALFESPHKVLLSYTLLFSWVDPSASFATGAWSIGNEWAFYSLFPILLFAWKRFWTRILAVTLAVLASSYYAFFIIDATVTVADQWSSYISPLNQILLFVGGMMVGSLILKYPKFRFPMTLIFAAGIVFLLISYTYEKQECINGFIRLILIFICLFWCYGAGVFQKLNGKIARALDWIGALSYSIYLLHPIVYAVTSKVVKETFLFTPDFILKMEAQGVVNLVIAIVGLLSFRRYLMIFLSVP